MRPVVIRRTRAIAVIFVTVLSLIALVGCSHADDPLRGTRWTLSGWTLSSLDPADFTITVKFGGGRISGSSGVNSYSGPYRLGSHNAFSAGPLASTEIGGTEQATRAEGAYLTLLGEAESYELVANRLTLLDKAGNESLIFTAASPSP